MTKQDIKRVERLRAMQIFLNKKRPALTKIIDDYKEKLEGYNSKMELLEKTIPASKVDTKIFTREKEDVREKLTDEIFLLSNCMQIIAKERKDTSLLITIKYSMTELKQMADTRFLFKSNQIMKISKPYYKEMLSIFRNVKDVMPAAELLIDKYSDCIGSGECERKCKAGHNIYLLMLIKELTTILTILDKGVKKNPELKKEYMIVRRGRLGIRNWGTKGNGSINRKNSQAYLCNIY